MVISSIYSRNWHLSAIHGNRSIHGKRFTTRRILSNLRAQRRDHLVVRRPKAKTQKLNHSSLLFRIIKIMWIKLKSLFDNCTFNKKVGVHFLCVFTKVRISRLLGAGFQGLESSPVFPVNRIIENFFQK